MKIFPWKSLLLSTVDRTRRREKDVQSYQNYQESLLEQPFGFSLIELPLSDPAGACTNVLAWVCSAK